ncbi:MAG: inositol 2-dehydrogenase [Clostridia bacterium]|nr:inositol 2-dehydrogenase [Clostridia bacterium]
MEKKLTVGIIGTGRIGKVHTMSIMNQLPEVEIKGVTDIFLDQAQAWADETGIKTVYKDYKELIADPDIDAVLVCSSTDTHADISIAAANAGKHVFCEKPVDLSIAKVEAVIDAAKKAGVKLQIGFNRRFDHNFRKVKELIDNNTIGDLQILKITSRDPSPPPAEYVKVSGGIFMDMTIHDFDMGRFLTGSEAEEVYVAAACMVDPAIGAAGDVDTALITIRFKNGTICVIDNSRKAAYGYDQRVEAFGSKGKVEITNDYPNTAVWSTEEGVFSEKPLYFFLERYMDSFAEEMKQFVSALINNTETPVTGIDGLQPIKLGLAARKSVAEGRPVKLSEIE